jgi:4'-phosphopantetheinyl transferase
MTREPVSVWAPASAAATAPTLDEAHVWRADVREMRPQIERFASLLRDDETRRVASLLVEDDRVRFILARGLLRLLLGAYLAVQPASLRFDTGPHGKPALTSAPDDLCFNLSHAGDHLLIAFAHQRAVGVDIEPVRSRRDPRLDHDKLAATFFAPEEQAALHGLADDARAAAFYVCWTRKEAYLKATGEGLLTPLNSFRVPLTPIAPLRPHLLPDSVAPQWALYDLPPIPSYAAALAVACDARPLARISCWQFQP